MLARLGNVLYWLGCLVAAILIGFAAFAALAGSGGGRWLFVVIFAIAAGASWLLGRAIRYVLAAT